ncbi:branched-chain amino acid ABC transporter permease [Paraburkholderia sp.]|uniref:branched-chain amino acid ABC transporter permease n=1 Tax=Paraburkholderia sp. TaxID=1926495 RepID=UPI00239884F7|nr:branched-chain amino acid ABC transporter permease [Paraburkholderia sp.]MDE1183770.1 branched-chain amino acid ABC transporter permease [Paraburkholderia sp.]
MTNSERLVFQRRWTAYLPWLALIALLAIPPCVAPQSWLLAYLAQTATMIVFALSYNLLLGETGLLSFGHAAYAGLGALFAARVFNTGLLPLPAMPLIGGIGGALAGVIFGFVSTRRAGTAFAMITLGIGELVAAAAWTLPDWFGGEAGVPIDRASGVPFASLTFGPAREAYALIAVWCVIACVAMAALSRTPLMRLANAVRDNPTRAAAIGCYPRRVRYAVVVTSGFFAGIAGTLGLINLELVSTESVGMLRSGAVLIATVIGGTGAFFGPVAGAVALTFFSVAVASMTRAWLLYLGLFFVVIVVAAPDGMAGFAQRQRARIAVSGWRPCAGAYLNSAIATGAWSVAVVLIVQTAYAVQFGVDGGESLPWGLATNSASVMRLSGALLALICVGGLATHRASRAWRQLDASASLDVETAYGDAR